MKYEAIEMVNTNFVRVSKKRKIEKKIENLREENKRKIKNIIKTLITIFITYLAFKYAKLERGYNGIGGELAIPIYCWIIFWIIPKTLKEIKK